MRDASTTTRRPRGFTLVELLVVIAIIGILITFILIAAQDGIRRAQERATQSLIAKLESGVAERLEAILLRRADITLGHQAVASVGNTTAPFPAISSPIDPNYLLVQALTNLGYLSTNQVILSLARAQIIAQYDLVRTELPDVFFVQGAPYGMGAAPYKGQYPMNFAGVDYPVGSGNYLVPIGAASAAGGAPGQPASVTMTSADPNNASGIFGASFQAAAGIYKNLGYLPQGYDGADNDGDGFVDDLKEGIGGDLPVSDPENSLNPQIHLSALITRRLAAHTHLTARSEMLYALLVEGGGPLGSVFNRDDFTSREVQDTDGDGLPEFVDAWGQPLQFFRWPIYYNNLSSTTLPATSGANYLNFSAINPPPAGYVQKGADPYSGTWDSTATYARQEARQTDPLDPNQTLMSPTWWSSSVNTVPASTLVTSGNANLFMTYFHSLIDPNGTSALGAGSMWDRGGAYSRRSFYSRILILSGGPDLSPGVYLFSDPLSTLGNTTAISQGLVQVENQAGPFDIGNRSAPLSSQISTPANYNASTIQLLTNGGDDVTNQGMASPSSGVQ